MHTLSQRLIWQGSGLFFPLSNFESIINIDQSLKKKKISLTFASLNKKTKGEQRIPSHGYIDHNLII